MKRNIDTGSINQISLNIFLDGMVSDVSCSGKHHSNPVPDDHRRCDQAHGGIADVNHHGFAKALTVLLV